MEGRRHPLNQSPLYKVTSPKRLAEVLGISLPDLEHLIAAEHDNYQVFDVTRSDGGKRKIEQPKARTQGLHRRVCDLLSRIETPEYLHSAIKGRSYLTNAAAHVGRGPMVKVDVRSFFRSVPRAAVYRFFTEWMRCAGDVSGMLARLLTVYGHLPTGSSASPILSYYAFKSMFDRIDALARERGLVLTVYVDDMCLSGAAATRRLLYEVRRIIASNGLKSHKARYFGPKRPKIVTGAVVGEAGLRLPNRRHLKIYQGYRALRGEADARKKLVLLTPLVSRLYEAAQVEARWLPKARAMTAMQRKLRAELAAGQPN